MKKIPLVFDMKKLTESIISAHFEDLALGLFTKYNNLL